MKFFDTHAHIGLIIEDPIEQLIIAQQANQEGITGIISICNNIGDFDDLYENLGVSSNVYFAAGVSPSEVQNPGREWEIKLSEYLQRDRVVALGETGLDYYRKYGDKKSQIELFIRQLDIADQLNLPVIIHNRQAGKDIMDVLSARPPQNGAVLHCYTENWSFAKKMMDIHEKLYFSFAGNVTYNNAHDLHETVKNLPLERIVIESESPFMVPVKYRGKRNKPAYLPSTAAFIGNIRKEDDEEVINALYQNALSLFRI